MKLRLLLGAFNTVALLSAGSVAAQNYQQMPISSGFSADVIANGIGSSTVTTNNDVDGVSFAFVAKDFQLTAASAPITYGIPLDGIINSVVATTPGLSYQLASFNANNSLRLAAVNDAGTLLFTTPKAATKLYMLAVSGSGTSTVNVVVNFTDATSQTFSGVALADWYNAANFAIQGIGRVKKPGATPNAADDIPSPEGGTNPRLYQSELLIDAANQTKLIQSVTITKASGSGLPNVFAFSVDAYSSCTPPTLQAAASITANSALVSWTAPTSAVSYDVYHSTSNAIPASTATPTYTGVTGTSTTIGGLNSNTNYYYWVRSNCSSGTSQSSWSFGGTFKTACSTFTVPYTENFDTTSTGSSTNNNTPSCWAYLESVSFAGYGYVVASNPFSSPNSYYLYNASGTTGNQMLVSPPTINLSDGNKRVRFYAKSASANYTLLVGTLSNPTDPASFTQIGSAITLTTTQTQYTVNIPAGADLQLAFKHGLGGTNRGIYIDNITVQEIPSCFEPTAVTVPSFTTNSATVSWTAPTPAPANGYEVYYSTTNTAPTSTTVLDGTNSVTSSTASASLNGLLADTVYYVWVRSNCGTTDKSIWSEVVASFRTGYCLPSSTNQNSWVSAFSSTGATTNMAYTSTAGIAGGYQNLTATSNKISNAVGVNTSIALTAGGPTCGFGIWVDWNNNLTFETTERMFATSGYVTTTSGSFAVPAGTAPGNYRMRLLTDFNTSAPSNPCGAITRGEFIDFIFEVTGALATAETSAKKNEVKVYPNPFKDVLYIAETRDMKSVSIADVSGRVVKTIENPGKELQLSELNSGLYLVTIIFKDGSVSTVKAIKK
ncbi:hypothetical protein J3D55_004164 [Chryseobacterium ginsenosidimutans]|uniref:fibronectin type III domain-containing protein n=1 Tax=Chryseobacterium ginsenosidimutans TaxID=687846 RepID=UPI002169A45A|nr:GEVED domain-containing protein [Chryseobacterium ginsenosidimutans]MCS3871248.1 hypothetical protein [Chryseobacterium ginsenosidimutans]